MDEGYVCSAQPSWSPGQTFWPLQECGTFLLGHRAGGRTAGSVPDLCLATQTPLSLIVWVTPKRCPFLTAEPSLAPTFKWREQW